MSAPAARSTWSISARRDTVPERYAGRKFYLHNPQVTLMRTTPEENARMGAWIGERLNRCDGPVRFLIPESGVSALDAPGQPFHDPEADAALFDALERARCGHGRAGGSCACRIAINDPEFADALVAHFTKSPEA